MSAATQPAFADASITERVRPERLGPLSFRGPAHAGPPSRTYGGEVAGQAVVAAGLTVPEDRAIHSAQTMFIAPGDTSLPVDYRVEEVRDGRSFTTRYVEAEQRGRTIFSMSASFQVAEESLEHQEVHHDAPGPEETPTPEEMFADHPESLRWIDWLTERVGLDVRFPFPPSRLRAGQGTPGPPRQQVWIRARRRTDGTALERSAAVAYLSDILLLSAALGPHGVTFDSGRLQFATITHSVWFHAPLRVDEWFLYDQRSDWAGRARALCRGEMYDGSGRLCASTVQEGLLRLRG